MKCPNCGHEQEDTVECEYCGVIFAYYEADQQRKSGGAEGDEAPYPVQTIVPLDMRGERERQQSLVPEDPFEPGKFDPDKPGEFEDSSSSITVPKDYMPPAPDEEEPPDYFEYHGVEHGEEAKPVVTYRRRLSFIRIFLFAFLAAPLIIIVALLFKKPPLEGYTPIGRSTYLAEKAMKKIDSLMNADMKNVHAKAVLTEHELNSLMGRGFGFLEQKENAAQEEKMTLQDIQFRIVNNQMLIMAFYSILGIDIQLTVKGKPFINSNGSFDFKPEKAMLGTLPIPADLIMGQIKKKQSETSDMQELLKAPDYLKEISIKRGLLILKTNTTAD